MVRVRVPGPNGRVLRREGIGLRVFNDEYLRGQNTLGISNGTKCLAAKCRHAQNSAAPFE